MPPHDKPSRPKPRAASDAAATGVAGTPTGTRAGADAAAAEAGTPPGRWVTLLAACVGLEGLALLGLGVAELVALTDGADGNVGLFLGLVAIYAAYGSVLVLAARGVLRLRRWSRSVGLLSQLIALLMTPTILGAGAWWVGVPLLVVAALGLVLLLAPPVGGRLTR